MKEYPIIFSAPMVRALLEGRKTQTRRLASSPLAKVQPGDRLWVRESFHPEGTYMADHPGDARSMGWKPSIHMPRSASRLTLHVTDVRRQRVGVAVKMFGEGQQAAIRRGQHIHLTPAGRCCSDHATACRPCLAASPRRHKPPRRPMRRRRHEGRAARTKTQAPGRACRAWLWLQDGGRGNRWGDRFYSKNYHGTECDQMPQHSKQQEQKRGCRPHAVKPKPYGRLEKTVARCAAPAPLFSNRA